MLRRNEGIDIVTEIGGLTSVDEARKLLASKLDEEHLRRIGVIEHGDALLKIANTIAMCEPERVFVNTGSAEDRATIRQLAIEWGEEEPLPMTDHTVHFDLPEEQGRIIDRTFYIANPGESVSSLGLKMLREEALDEIREKMTGLMAGQTLIVGFYVRGPVGSPASNPALELTSSAYVSHSADILYRNAYDVFQTEVDKLGYFYTNIHGQGANRREDLPNARVFMDRSHWTTYSIFCTYAGNTLLLKKGNHRFTVDKATYLGRGKELSEHMFITGMNGPGDRITWICGAAPSGCGKTTTAMAGDHFVGDDLAQMWIAADGTVRVINPECGLFGIVRDVTWKGDPHLMRLLRRPGTEVIWSNVLIDGEGVPQWIGNDADPAPTSGRNFQGEWAAGDVDDEGNPIPMSHPNARCTVTASALANYTEECENLEGVMVRVVTYSGRDADTMPPVWAAKTSDEGVVIGANIVSKATATEVGASGVRRQPWANAPFIPGALGDYMRAQFEFFGSAAIDADKRPTLAGLNYFLTHEARSSVFGDEASTGSGLLGEKRDVRVWLGWLDRFAHGEVDAIETPIGYLPLYEDLERLFAELIDKPYPASLYTMQFSLFVDNIIARIDMQEQAYATEEGVPHRLFEILEAQRAGLEALKKEHGSIVRPSALGG